MRTADAGTVPLSVLTSPWRSTCRLGEAARHRACIQFALASRSFSKIMFPSYPPTPEIAILCAADEEWFTHEPLFVSRA